MTDKKFVALKAIRFGAVHLQPGDPVPVEAGRDYRQMLRLGQIAEVQPVPAADQQDLPLLTPFEPGSTVVFVAEDGAYVTVTFQGAQEAPDDVREGLELKEGDVVASVVWPEDEDPTFVPIGSLLPGEPTLRLIAELEAQVENATVERAPGDVDEITSLQGRTAFLELLIQAIRAEGDPLPDDFPALKELQSNGVTTLQGVQLLAQGEQGKANLMALDQIGEGRADKILAQLAAPSPAPDASPEG